MFTETFGFYSTAGEELARRLVAGICADVEADLVTRRKALDRLSDAMERVADIDGSAPDPDPLRAIAEFVSRSFERAGYLPVSADDLLGHFSAWRRTGAPISGAALPPAVAMAAESAREVTAAAFTLAGRGDVSVAVSEEAPWSPGFHATGAAAADIVLFVHADDPGSVVEANPFLGCAILGSEASGYLDWLVSAALPGSAEERLRGLLPREGLDHASLMADLVRLERAASSLNLAARLANQPGRMGVSLAAGPGDAPLVICSWDGIAVVPPPVAPDVPADPAGRRRASATVAEALSADLFVGADAAEIEADSAPAEASQAPAGF